MSGSLSKSIGLSTSFVKIVEQECPSSMVTGGGGEGKQGIAVAILGSEDHYCERSRASSLRRTLSADMSSKTWLAQNGLLISPMKKIASSKELVSIPSRRLDSFSSSEDDDDDDDDYEKNSSTKAEQAGGGKGEYDIWSLIISQKAKEESKSAASTPYVHPLVKSRASSLSENSLKICTESLGCETGSDGFSLTGDSSSSDIEITQEEEKEKTQLKEAVEQTTPTVVTRNKSVTPTRSFPPPLTSLSGDGASKVRMQTRRDNGRLVVEAVSVPSQKNYFAAQRQDGRLVLTFDVSADDLDEKEVKTEEEDVELMKEDGEFEEQFGNCSEDDEDNKEDEDEDEDEHGYDDNEEDDEIVYGVTEESSKLGSPRVINVHRLALMMNKPIGLANMNLSTTTPWSKKLNEDYADEDQKIIAAQTTLAQSLPPRPRPAVGRLIASPPATLAKGAAAATASFNAYEYFWRRSNPTATTTTTLKMNNCVYNNKIMNNHHRLEPQMLVLRGNKGEYMVSTLKGCKEPRRTLFWEPYCIATSS
ncbi:protein FAF-like, chloroplastic [Cannabis sativa]|uniref:protein FAF-like, chloroplastic n=1 Tax=Cannabis sativa TaxID=3483 RepID=UPI0029CA924F|nr:protein FAF-like, chloroplastic [Cannabis sativa]